MESDHLINGPGSSMQVVKRMKTLLVVVLTGVAAVLLAVIIGDAAMSSAIQGKIDRTFGKLNTEPREPPINAKTLPRSWHVPDTAITPVKDQAQRGTCWVFSTMGALEADYRANGIAKGFLKENEYVSFSEQAYGLGVIDFCTAHPTLDLCYGAGPIKNTTEDGTPEWLYYFGEPVQHVLPTAACPYHKTNDEQFICPDRQAKLAKNPIKFKVTGIESAMSLHGIKELLVKHGKPLTWSHVVSEQTYSVPCSTSESIQNSPVCKECVYSVDPTDPSKGCNALYILPSYDNEGRFSLHGQPFISGGHAMLLVGYNDNFRVDTGKLGELKERTLGGFIIKNSWGTELGHSIKYWAQEISTLEEAFLCPDVSAASKWLPADAECLVGGGSLAECAPDTYKRVRDQWVVGATELKCSSISKDAAAFYGFADCDPSKHYVLAQAPSLKYNKGGNTSGAWAVALPSGNLRVYLVEFTPGERVSGAKLVHTGETSWLGMTKLFTPVNATSANDPDVCGYFFLPYQYFQEGNVINPVGGHDTPSCSAFTVEWDDSSYLANRDKYPQYDYTYLEQSQKTMGMYTFNGADDYDYNKH